MPQPKARRVHIGTSGWSYPEWRGHFYPQGLPQARWFTHYAAAFKAVELNNTFYRLPSGKLFRAWAERAPAGFIYAVKAPRALTHRQHTDPAKLVQGLTEGARELGDHMGPILYQFPPWLVRDAEMLRSFLPRLPGGFDHIIEFRHSSWYEEEVQQLLTGMGVGFCIHDMRGSASPAWITSPIGYFRLHGPGRRKYTGRYGIDRLRSMAGQLLRLGPAVRDIYVFFNNTVAAAAAADALELDNLLAKEVPVSSCARL